MDNLFIENGIIPLPKSGVYLSPEGVVFIYEQYELVRMLSEHLPLLCLIIRLESFSQQKHNALRGLSNLS